MRPLEMFMARAAVEAPRYAKIRPVKTRQRFLALVAAFAVAFGSLWPLVSAAAPRSHGLPNFICTQSGFQHPGAPLPQEDKSHCPLCVMTVESAPPFVTPPVARTTAAFCQHAGAFTASLKPAFLAHPPPSRAPPQHS